MLDRSVEAFLDDLLEFVEDGKVVQVGWQGHGCIVDE